MLVEDNPADADLVQEGLENSKLLLEITVLGDGASAIQYLKRAGIYSDAEIPDLIVLDLNLPRKDGRQVLVEIKSDNTLRRIPVVVLTSSDAERDIIESYNLGANCYITKPLDLRAFHTIVQSVEQFWFTIARLPRVEM